MTHCPPHFTGDSCDWPICENGHVESSSRTCICLNHFAPPFCEECEHGFWGAACDKTAIDPLPDNELPTWLSVMPYLPQAILLLSIVVLMSGIFCGLRMAGLCPRRLHEDQEEALAQAAEPEIKRAAPPSYVEALTTDPPPPYTL